MPRPGWTAARLLEVISALERVLTIGAFTALVLVVFADVVSRELTGGGLYWASQVGVWANIIVVMAGFGLASSVGGHLRPRFTDTWLPDRWSATLTTLQHLFMALFCCGIGLLAANVTAESWSLGVVSIDLFMPIWPVQIFLPLAFVAATLRHLVYALVPGTRPAETSALATGMGAGRK